MKSVVGFPSVFYEYVLLLLVNKECVLTHDSVEYRKSGNSSIDRGGKKVDSDRCHGVVNKESCQKQETGRLQPHGDT